MQHLTRNLSADQQHQAGLNVPNNLEVFVNASEAGAFLGLHPATVQRLARQGLIPAHPIAGRKRRHWRFLRSELGEWLRGRSCERGDFV